MSKLVATLALTPALAEAFADGSNPSVEVYAAVGGGYVFTYVNTFSGHDCYAAGYGATPYATVEAALAAATDIPDESNVATGPGADAGEFEGEVA